MQVNAVAAVTALLNVGCLLFFLIALGASYWESATSVHVGLFQYCGAGTCYTIDSSCDVSSNGVSVSLADDFGFSCSSFNAVRAFTFLAMFTSALSLVLMLVYIIKGNESLKIPVCVLLLVQGIFGMIAMAIFVGKVYTSPNGISTSYDYSFGLEVAAWTLSMVLAPIFFVGTGATST